MNAPSIHTGVHAAEGLATLLWACEPDVPHRLRAPFFHAAAVAALDLAGRDLLHRPQHALAAVRCCRRPERIGTPEGGLRRLARGRGARRGAVCCSNALHVEGLEAVPLIPECTRRRGAVQFMARAADLRWCTLVF